VVFWVVPVVCGRGTIDCSPLLQGKRES
jgi:hypothetical protein